MDKLSVCLNLTLDIVSRTTQQSTHLWMSNVIALINLALDMVSSTELHQQMDELSVRLSLT
jgi:hypothetical protein